VVEKEEQFTTSVAAVVVTSLTHGPLLTMHHVIMSSCPPGRVLPLAIHLHHRPAALLGREGKGRGGVCGFQVLLEEVKHPVLEIHQPLQRSGPVPLVRKQHQVVPNES
jgi:hypothetical protein